VLSSLQWQPKLTRPREVLVLQRAMSERNRGLDPLREGQLAHRLAPGAVAPMSLLPGGGVSAGELRRVLSFVWWTASKLTATNNRAFTGHPEAASEKSEAIRNTSLQISRLFSCTPPNARPSKPI
jgi:hypothetical protein